MPELPEVETIVRDLDNKIRNKTILSLETLDKKVFPSGRIKEVIGRKIRSVRRRAKTAIFDLGGLFLVIHLKMTGQLVYKKSGKIIAGGHPIKNVGSDLPNKFTRAIFRLSGSSSLFFNDVRKFGWIKLMDEEGIERHIKSFGLEPLSRDFSYENFQQALNKKKKTSVKQALMEQKNIAGIGNIYADESLFAARIKPFRKVADLKEKEVKKLWRAIPKILALAVKHRGTSFNDYVDAEGQAGNFVKYLKVYGRTEEKCRHCSGLVKKMKLGGRGTHWCDSCQK
jgi:formamidopyrimidine-DNA glycosylase